MHREPMTAAGALEAPEVLVQALRSRGLAARIVEGDGAGYVRVSPPRAPAAGTDVRWTSQGGRAHFYSEWGAPIGYQLPAVVDRVLFWFGKTGRPRP